MPLGVVVASGAEPGTGTGGVVQPVHKYVQVKEVVGETTEFKKFAVREALEQVEVFPPEIDNGQIISQLIEPDPAEV